MLAVAITQLVSAVVNAYTAISTCLTANTCPHVENLGRNLELLKLKNEELIELIDTIDRQQLGNQVIAFDPNWTNTANQSVEESQVFLDKVDKKLLKKCFPKCFSRLEVGKKIEEMIGAMDGLLQRGRRVDNLSVRGNIRPRPRVTQVGQKTVNVIEEIWKYVTEDEEVGVIGVFGMSGVGKTAVVTEINNRALQEIKHWNERRKTMVSILTVDSRAQEFQENNCFDYVFWVDGPYGPNLGKLQNQIAKKIRLDLANADSDVERAEMLLDALAKKSKFLLIIDDIWGTFSLDKIGIPKPTKENGCKVMVTSTSASVCSGIKTDKDVDVELLTEGEAWNLFVDEVGLVEGFLPEETLTIVKEVAKECGGLPLAVITVAKSLRRLNSNNNNNSDVAWKNALTDLKESRANLKYMEDRDFGHLRFGIARLEETTRSCFLYCALYPRGCHIITKELIEYWMWEGLLDDGKGKIKDCMRQGERILDELIDARLLDSISQEEGIQLVKMHNLIRDMAVHITRTQPRFFIKAGFQLREPPLEKEWPEDVVRASLMRNHLKGLGHKPNCPKLSSLLLQHNFINMNFSEHFFLNMTSLKILDLSYTSVSSLPVSLSNLKNLHALLLRKCNHLKRVPSLSELESLMVLDLSDTPIEQLPVGMKMLTKLRRLNLSRTRITKFPAGLVPAFSCLQELLMINDDSGYLWGSKFENPDMGAYIEELTASIHLVVLEINFRNARAFHEYVNNMEPQQDFKFCIGGSFSGKLGKNSLTLMGEFLVHGAPVSLPQCTSELNIIQCDDITRLPSTYDLGSLKVVDISNCGNLFYLFKSGMQYSLPNLEEISIKQCPNIVKLVEPDAKVTFPKLLQLVLYDLPKLESICQGELVSDSLETIKVWDCNQLQIVLTKLFDLSKLESIGELASDSREIIEVQARNQLRIDLTTLPHRLIEIRGKKAWLESLKRENPRAKTFFQFIEASASEEVCSIPRVRMAGLSRSHSMTPPLSNGTEAIESSKGTRTMQLGRAGTLFSKLNPSNILRFKL